MCHFTALHMTRLAEPIKCRVLWNESLKCIIIKAYLSVSDPEGKIQALDMLIKKAPYDHWPFSSDPLGSGLLEREFSKLFNYSS